MLNNIVRLGTFFVYVTRTRPCFSLYELLSAQYKISTYVYGRFVKQAIQCVNVKDPNRSVRMSVGWLTANAGMKALIGHALYGIRSPCTAFPSHLYRMLQDLGISISHAKLILTFGTKLLSGPMDSNSIVAKAK